MIKNVITRSDDIFHLPETGTVWKCGKTQRLKAGDILFSSVSTPILWWGFVFGCYQFWLLVFNPCPKRQGFFSCLSPFISENDMLIAYLSLHLYDLSTWAKQGFLKLPDENEKPWTCSLLENLTNQGRHQRMLQIDSLIPLNRQQHVCLLCFSPSKYLPHLEINYNSLCRGLDGCVAHDWYETAKVTFILNHLVWVKMCLFLHFLWSYTLIHLAFICVFMIARLLSCKRPKSLTKTIIAELQLKPLVFH